MNAPSLPRHRGIAGRIAAAFIGSRLTPLVIIASILLGVGAVLLLPREEEPQIVVPMVDVFVRMPGASASEVENRVTRPMEKLLWEIPGVEYVYSTTSPGQSMAIVRFKVGEDEEKSIVRLNQKMSANFDLIPPGATPASGQAALHRRRPDPRDHALLRPSRPVLAAADRAAAARPGEIGPGRLGGEDHRRPATPGAGAPRPGPDGGARRRPGRPRRHAAAGEPPASLGEHRRREPGVPRRDGRVPPHGRGRGPGGGGSLGGAARLPSGRGADRGRAGGAGRLRPLRDRAGGARERPRGAPRGDPLRRQAEGDQRDRGGRQGPREGRGAERDPRPGRRHPDGHAELRRDGRGEVERTPPPHADRRRLGVDPHLVHPRVPGGGDRRDGHPRDPRPHPHRLLPHRVHAEPGDALRAHLLHRDSRRRRDRRGREHRPPLPASGEPGALRERHRRGGGGRGREPDDPRHVRRHRRDPSDGVRPGPDGPVHAADPGGRHGGHALLAPRRLHRHPLDRGPAAAEGGGGSGSCRRGVDHAPLPGSDGAAPSPARVAVRFPRDGRRPAARIRFAGRAPVGAGEDAPVRQQERVPGGGRHAGRVDPRADRGRDPGDRRRHRGRARSAELPDVRRDFLPVQLQRAGAPLLPAAGARTLPTFR